LLEDEARTFERVGAEATHCHDFNHNAGSRQG
jgi:hypothetical protein